MQDTFLRAEMQEARCFFNDFIAKCALIKVESAFGTGYN